MEDTRIPGRHTLTVKEVADILGVSPNSVRAAIKDGRIPNVGMTRSIRIPRRWVEGYLETGGRGA